MCSSIVNNLATQLAALREAHSSPQSESKIPSSLSLFLAIYLKSEKLCNLNYMEGAEILYSWLAPVAPIPTESPTRVPRLFRTYEVTQLAKIISPSTSSPTWLKDRRVAEDTIYSVGTRI